MIKLISIDKLKEKQHKARLKKLTRLSYRYLSAVKDYLNSNKDLSVFYITLTFKDMQTFQSNKEKSFSYIRNYMKNLKQDIQRNQGYKVYTYFWVLEKQSRGVPHYHIFLVSDKKAYIKFPDKSYWAWGMSQVQRVSYDKISKNYLSKYLAKQNQKDFYDMIEFKGMRLYTIYICSELKNLFFDVLISTYNMFRYKLAKYFKSFISKKNGYYKVGDVGIKLLISFMYQEGFCYVIDDGIKVNVDGQEVYFNDYSDFWQALDFVCS